MSPVYLTTEQVRGRNFRRALLISALSFGATIVLMLFYAWMLYPLHPGWLRSTAENLTYFAIAGAMVTAAAAVGYVVANRLATISFVAVRYGAGIVTGLVIFFVIFVLIVNLQLALGIPM